MNAKNAVFKNIAFEVSFPKRTTHLKKIPSKTDFSPN
jgi:hypothetical protein